MSVNSRMSVAIHVLSFLISARRKGRDPVTSDRIAHSVNTNPVVIRRILGLLLAGGMVRSHRGANAGGTLARKAGAITLLDVYKAVEEGPLFRLHASPPNPRCPVGRGIQPALRKVYGPLEEQLRRELAETTVERVLDDALG